MKRSLWEERLAELAARNGLEPEYYDVAGNLHHAEAETKVAILAAMGFHCQTLEDLEQALADCICRPWCDLVEPVLARHQAELPAAWNLYLPLTDGKLPAALEVRWELTDEAGTCIYQESLGPSLQVAEGRPCQKKTYGRIAIPLPKDLPLGYFDLRVQADAAGFEKQGQMLVVVAPERMYIPESLTNKRIWGITLPLYAMRSSGNWGIGDCGDLQRLVAMESILQADILGLNPLHHPGTRLDEDFSPYYPTSRSYASPLYVNLAAVPEMAVSQEAREYLARPEIQQHLANLRERHEVDYAAVAHLKAAVLSPLLETFLSRHGWPGSPKTDRGRDFAEFLAEQGDGLRRFGTFLALSEFWQAQGRQFYTWQEWPAAYHNPAGPAVAEFARSHERQVLVHLYAQWLLDGQLQEVQAEARRQNLSLGLYLDLAVGINPGGFDTWANQELFALNVNIGAPPDPFSPLGQNWGLAPLLPRQLRQQKYRYFIQMLRQNSPVGGALRLDHVMGLFRLFWIPRGAGPAKGAYVRYPAADLLKILALESVKRQTVIIGEDLGTVPPQITAQLAEHRVLSTKLFYFERQQDGACTEAAHYPEWAVAAITTHDLPTLAGFWQGRDIQKRQELNLLPDAETAAHSREERRRAKAAILALLEKQELIRGDQAAALAVQAELPEPVKWGIIAHLAKTSARLVILNLEDIFGWPDQQNMPGTKNEYPNWRLKFPRSLEEILQAPEPMQVAEIMRRGRTGQNITSDD